MSDQLERYESLLVDAAPRARRPVDPDHIWATARRRTRRTAVIASTAVAATLAISATGIITLLSTPTTPVIDPLAPDERSPEDDVPVFDDTPAEDDAPSEDRDPDRPTNRPTRTWSRTHRPNPTRPRRSGPRNPALSPTPRSLAHSPTRHSTPTPTGSN